jgi:serine/threonine protein kinase
MPYQACDLEMVIKAFKGAGRKLSRRTLGQLLMEYVLAARFLKRVGITPRDVEPKNIFLSWNGHLMLADYGMWTVTRVAVSEGE